MTDMAQFRPGANPLSNPGKELFPDDGIPKAELTDEPKPPGPRQPPASAGRHPGRPRVPGPLHCQVPDDVAAARLTTRAPPPGHWASTPPGGRRAQAATSRSASDARTYGPVGTVLVTQSWLADQGIVVFGGALVGQLLHKELPRVARALKRRG